MDGKNTAGSYSALVVLETGPPCAGAFYMLPQYRAALDVRQGALPCRSLQVGNDRNDSHGSKACVSSASKPVQGPVMGRLLRRTSARSCTCLLERGNIRAPATTVMRRDQIQGFILNSCAESSPAR